MQNVKSQNIISAFANLVSHLLHRALHQHSFAQLFLRFWLRKTFTVNRTARCSFATCLGSRNVRCHVGCHSPLRLVCSNHHEQLDFSCHRENFLCNFYLSFVCRKAHDDKRDATNLFEWYQHCEFKIEILIAKFNYNNLQMTYGITAFILSNILGLILTLTFDLPMNSIWKMINEKSKLQWN